MHTWIEDERRVKKQKGESVFSNVFRKEKIRLHSCCTCLKSGSRSTFNRGPLRRETYDLLWKMLKGNKDEETEIFKQCNRKFIYKNGKTTDPNFFIALNEDNEEAIFRIVTHMEK